MQAQFPQKTLLSLVLSLLLLSAALAMPGCSSSYQMLLSQLQRLANDTEDPRSLAEPYMHHQSLNTTTLRKSCTEHPAAFPSEDALRALSKLDFLHTIDTMLGQVQHRVEALKQQFVRTQNFPQLENAEYKIRGIRNNVYCMSWLLRRSQKTLEPTQTSSRALLSPAPTSDTFQAKLDSCRFLWGYHSFMGSVGRVFSEWGDSLSRSRRHSPRRALHKRAHGFRHSRSSQRPMPRS
uniref:Oncostatin-M n=2 Tax=Nannospalax galili TaxID=1026970 RepID=A0A8C6W3H5_NANGA